MSLASLASSHPFLSLVGGLVALLAILIACYALFIVRERRKYSHIPGPPSSSFFGGNGQMLADAESQPGGKFQMLIQLAKDFGPLFKITSLHFVFLIASSPEIAKELLTKSKYRKSPIVYDMLRKILRETFFGDSIVTLVDHEAWKLRRHALNPTFHRAFLSGLLPAFNRAADGMLEELDARARSGDPVVLLEVFGRATLDAICRIAFSFDFQAGGGSVARDLRLSCDAFSAVANNPFLPMDPRRRHEVRRFREALRSIRSVMEQILDRRLRQMSAGEETPRDILAIMLEGLLAHCSREDIVSEMVTLLAAGQETTAATLASLLMELGRQAEYEQRVREEVQSVMGDKDAVEAEDLDRLPWVTAVLKEALRLYPPGEGTTREVAEDTEIGGFKVFKGAMVVVSFVAIHYLHHEDGANFRPEKWLPENEARSNFNFMPFSLGQRSCIGRQFAWMEAKVLLAKFFQRFRYELDPSERFLLKESLTVRPASGVLSRVFRA